MKYTIYNRKKVLIIRKIKSSLIDDKHKDDEEIENEKQYIENEDDSSSEESTSQSKCPNLITEIIKTKWKVNEGLESEYEIYMEYPRSTCKDNSVKGIVGCCGVLKWCDKKLKKDKKEGNEKDSKLVEEIKKVKKKQKSNNKGE